MVSELLGEHLLAAELACRRVASVWKMTEGLEAQISSRTVHFAVCIYLLGILGAPRQLFESQYSASSAI